MKKYQVFTIFVLMVLSACNLPGQSPKATDVVVEVNATQNPIADTPSPSSSESNDSCGNPYYPIVNGAEWNYTGPNGAFTHSLSTGSEGAFTVTVQSADSQFILQGLCLEGGDINLLEAPGNSLTFQGDSGGSTMKTTSNDGVTLPGDIQSGDDWSQTLGVEVGANNLTMNFTIENSFKAAGYEMVSVPAGTFDALKVEMESTTDGGDPITQTLWYVKDVGLVKSIIDLDTPVVQELVSYSIPND